MKHLILINLLVIFISGCTNKLPIPGSNNIESILIIPFKGKNTTKIPFGFFYTFTLKAEDGSEKFIKLLPRKNKKYFLFDSLAPGTYKFESRSDCLAIRGRTKNNCKNIRTRPMQVKLASNSITIFKMKFNVKQSWEKNTNMINAKFSSLTKGQAHEIIDELKTLENFKSWEIICESCKNDTVPVIAKSCEDLGKSEGGGREVTLNFNNQTNTGIEAFWVDYEGKLKSYGTISSGEIREQGTFEKHPWLFENVDTKKCLGTYIPQFSHDKKQLNIME